MNIEWSRVPGWLLMGLLGCLLIEIAAVGAFMAGWCLTCIFGKYALAVLAVMALLILLGLDDLFRRRAR